MKPYHKETRIERHNMQIRWAATLPFMMAMTGFVMYYQTDLVPKWLDLAMIAVGLSLGVLFMGLSHSRIAIAPFLYKFRGRNDSLYVIVHHGDLWDKALHRPITWQRVLRIVPGVYLLLGEPFMANGSELERSKDLFHPSLTEVDDEKDADD